MAQILGGLDVVALFAETLTVLLVVFIEVQAAVRQGLNVVEVHGKPDATSLLASHAQWVHVEPSAADRLQLAAA